MARCSRRPAASPTSTAPWRCARWCSRRHRRRRAAGPQSRHLVGRVPRPRPAAGARPAMNLIYADVDGNIGYQMVGRVPIRARGEGLVPSPGWSGQYEWQRLASRSTTCRARSTRPTGCGRMPITTSRKQEHALLQARVHRPARYQPHSAGAREQARATRRSTSARCRRTRSVCRRDASPRRLSSILAERRVERRALEELRRWDGRISADSAAASIYEVFRNELVRARHAEALGDLLPALLGVGPHPLLGADQLALLLADRSACWRFVEAAPRSRRSAARFGRRSAWLLRKLGPECRRLAVGPPAPAAPGARAVDAQAAGPGLRRAGAFRGAATWRRCAPVAARPARYDASGRSPRTASSPTAVIGTTPCRASPAGQSGHRGSPHYADQVDAWRRVAYHPLAFTRP